ncbi:MAG: hypothetical protein ACFFBD_20615 [Candidatus Hodarchaeota archaeon]
MKALLNYIKANYSKSIYNQYLRVMADFALVIAQEVGADPIICTSAALLHKLADNITGPYRANKVNPVLRDCGYEGKVIQKVMACVVNLLPENQSNRTTLEEKVVADAYLLTYWPEITGNFEFGFELEVSEKIFLEMDI